MAIQLTSVVDAGGDLLLVSGYDDTERAPDDWDVEVSGEWQPSELTAQGWVSATTNYYQPDAYYPEGSTVKQQGTDSNGNPLPTLDVSGQHKPGAKPRAMTSAEVGAYARSLLEATLPQDHPVVTPPTPVAFS